MDSGAGRDDVGGWAGEVVFRRALDDLGQAVQSACERRTDWPAQIAAGVYAGVEFAIASPALARELGIDPSSETDYRGRYELVIGRLADFIRERAPTDARLPASTDEALVGGIVGLVGDHVRIGRGDRLLELRPDLVLLALLPYLGFAEAREWANRFASDNDNSD